MKRLFVPIAIMATMFTSCKKYDVSEELNLESLPDKVILQGTAYARLDETLPAGQYKVVPKEVLVVSVSIPYKDYDANSRSNGFYVKKAKIDADGKYSVEIPVVSTGVTATISFEDFPYDVKTENGVGQTSNVLKHFTCADVVVAGLGKGQSVGKYHKIDATYSVNATEPNATELLPTKTVDVTGKMEYIAGLDSSASPNYSRISFVPSGTNVTAIITLVDPNSTPQRTYKVTQTVRIEGSGAYNMKVPMAEGCVATVKLHGEEFWEVQVLDPNVTVGSSTRQQYRFILDGGFTAYNTTLPQTKKDQLYEMKEFVTDL